MFTEGEATKERVASYEAALKDELHGYEQRLLALAEGKFERLTHEQLDARVAGVKDELARVNKHASKSKSKSKAEKDAG